MLELAYTIENDRRVLVGLSYEETVEFEILCAETPMHGTPPADDERRWLELFGKHEAAAKLNRSLRTETCAPRRSLIGHCDSSSSASRASAGIQCVYAKS